MKKRQLTTQIQASTLVWILVVSVVATSLPATIVVGTDSTPVAVTDATLSASEIHAGQTVTVAATVTNTGQTNETATVSLQVDGAVRDSTTVSVPANTTTSVEFTETFDAPGTYDVAVDDVTAGTLTVVEPSSPEFTVTNVTLAASEVLEDTETGVSATVANTGDADGTTTLDLTADGTVVDTATVSVPAGSSATASFSPTFENPGNYTLAVDGVDGGTIAVLDDPTLVEECTVITESGDYRLGEDLTAPGTAEYCIAIEASDVTLDGQGYTLDGTSGFTSEKKTVHYGVDVSGSSDAHITNVRIEDLTVTEWTHGVNLDGVTDAAVVDVTAEHNRVGVALRDSHDTAVVGGQYVDNAKHGVRVRGHSETVRIEGATVDGNGARGIFVNRASAITVSDNAISANTAGVLVRDTVGVTVRGNTLVDNRDGVVLGVSNDSSVLDNDIAGGDVGILVRATHGKDSHESGDDHDSHESGDDHQDVVPGATTISGNTVTGSSVGISLVGTANDVLADNTVTDAGTWAVTLEDGASDVEITDLELDGGRVVDLTGTDVGVRAASAAAPTPAGHALVGGAVELAATSGAGTVQQLALSYDPDAVGSAEDRQPVVSVWHHDGSDWTRVGSPADWRYDAGNGDWYATAVAGTAVDGDRHRVSAPVEFTGVFAPMAGRDTTGELTVTASVEESTVDNGRPVTIDATVATSGSERTTAILDLTVDGSVVESVETEVTPEEPTAVTFTRTFESGQHELAVSGVDAGTVTVLASRQASSSRAVPDHPTAEVTQTSDGRSVVSVGYARLAPEVRVPLDLQDADSCVVLDELALATTEFNWYQLTVQQTVSAPAGTPVWSGADGPAFGYIVIEAPDGAAGNVTQTFRLSADCLDERGVAPTDVVLYHHVDGEWVPLETRATDVSDDVVTFVAESPSLSVFAVGTTTPDIRTTELTVDSTTVTAGETVRASATYRNDGNADGDVVVELAVDGVVRETRAITVAAGGTETVVFEPVLDTAGQRVISIDGTPVGTVDVAAASTLTPSVPTTAESPAGEERGPADTGVGLTGMLLLGVLVVVGGAYLLLRRT
jgi:parallel beta-helix repeat protein